MLFRSQTTILPFVVYRQIKDELRLEGHVFASDDLNHSNKMVQHCMSIVIQHYQEVLHSEGKTVLLITHSVDEAIYLSSRIVVVTARPARIREVIEVPFAYPRRPDIQADRRFSELSQYLKGLVMHEYAQQARQALPATD